MMMSLCFEGHVTLPPISWRCNSRAPRFELLWTDYLIVFINFRCRLLCDSVPRASDGFSAPNCYCSYAKIFLSPVCLWYQFKISATGGVDIRKTNDEIRAWQDQFLQIPRAATCESFFKYYTSMPHYPASAGAAAMVWPIPSSMLFPKFISVVIIIELMQSID